MMLNGFALLLAVTSLFGSTTIQSFICTVPAAPTISQPVDGSVVTPGALFAIGGTGEQNASIILSVNNIDVLSVQADGLGFYYGNISVSTEGNHTVGVRAERTCGTTLGDTISVVAATTDGPEVHPQPDVPIPPIRSDDRQPSQSSPVNPVTGDDQNTSKGLFLSIFSPEDASATTDGSVFVSGSTSEPATVSLTVNGEVAGATHVSATTFGMSVPLVVGENTIIASATSSGGSASARILVTREELVDVAWYQTETAKTAAIVAAGGISVLAIIGIIRRILLPSL